MAGHMQDQMYSILHIRMSGLRMKIQEVQEAKRWWTIRKRSISSRKSILTSFSMTQNTADLPLVRALMKGV